MKFFSEFAWIAIIFVIVSAVIITAGWLMGKNRRLKKKLEKAKIETDRCGELSYAQIKVWYSSRRGKMNSSTKGILATKQAVVRANSAVSFPVSAVGKHVLVQSLYNNEEKPIDYRFIICDTIEENLGQLLDSNDGYIVFSEIKKGVK